MSNQETERFLKDFKELENLLVSMSGLDESMGFVSFSRALDAVKNERRSPVVCSGSVYSFLKNANDLRNMLSHENNICVPTLDFIQKFETIKNEIAHPLTAYQICTKADKIVYATYSSKLSDVVDLMVKGHLSHVPVIAQGEVKGVFSSTTFFQSYFVNRRLKVDEDFTIADFLSVTGVKEHLNEQFTFISRNERAITLVNKFAKGKSGDKRTPCLFVTEHGKENEKLLGLITESDLMQIPLLERQMQK